MALHTDYKLVVPLRDDQGLVTFYSGTVDCYRLADGRPYRIIIDNLEFCEVCFDYEPDKDVSIDSELTSHD